MGYRELFLTLGAISLFGVLLLNSYRWMIDQKDNKIQKEFEFYSISLAQSFIEEAKTRAFDKFAITSTPDSPADLTPYDQLGPATGESYPHFDDVDDYNNLARTDSTTRGTFNVNISVGYVEKAKPDSIVSYQTYYKRMAVNVTNEYLDAPIQFGYIFGYIQN